MRIPGSFKKGKFMHYNRHDFAIEIEKIFTKITKKDFAHSPTIFSADSIELGSFYDCICILLFCYGKEGTLDFFDDLHVYKGLNMNKIKMKDLIAIRTKFYELLDLDVTYRTIN